MKFLHSMIRVSDPQATVAFFQLLGLEERRRIENEPGRFTLIFLGVPGDDGGEVELTYNWDEAGYGGGRNFGHLAYQVDDIYETCRRLMDGGVTINRPPRDGRMAFVRSPDNISVELLQKGQALDAGRALGVDAEQRRMVGWLDRRFVDLVGTRASDRPGANGRRRRSRALRCGDRRRRAWGVAVRHAVAGAGAGAGRRGPLAN